tara:strand:- start:1440 stop:1664 length:225 start_codon:yes stop_codon:yes gene_type:complete
MKRDYETGVSDTPIFFNKEYELLKNELELVKEDIECVEMYLDSKGIPRYAVDNQAEYSLVGRIKLLKTIRPKTI